MNIFLYYISVFLFSSRTVFSVLDKNVKTSTKPPLTLEKLPWLSHFELQSPTEYYEEDDTGNEYIERKNSGFHSFNSLCPPGETGQFHYPPDCKRFINCWRGRSSIQVCAPGTLFNPESRECDFPSKVRCTNEDFGDFTSLPTKERYVRFPHHRPAIANNPRIARNQNENPASETIPAKPYPGRPPYFGPSHLKPPTRPSTSNSKNERYLCPVGATGIFPHPSDCSKFVECFSGGTFIKNCGPGTLFNTMTSSCDHPKNVACSHEETQVPDAPEILPLDDKIPEESVLREQYQKLENKKLSSKKGKKKTELENSKTKEISENLIISSTPKTEVEEMLETPLISQTESSLFREPKVINVKKSKPNQISITSEKEPASYLLPPQYDVYGKPINDNLEVQKPNKENNFQSPFQSSSFKNPSHTNYPAQGPFSQNQFSIYQNQNPEESQKKAYLGYILNEKHSLKNNPDQFLTYQNYNPYQVHHFSHPYNSQRPLHPHHLNYLQHPLRSHHFQQPQHSQQPHSVNHYNPSYPSLWLQPPPFPQQYFTHYAPNHPFSSNSQPPTSYNYHSSLQPMTGSNNCPTGETAQKNQYHSNILECEKKDVSQYIPNLPQFSSETINNPQNTETKFLPNNHNTKNINSGQSDTNSKTLNNANFNGYNPNTYIPYTYLNPTYFPTLTYIPQKNGMPSYVLASYPPFYNSQNSNDKIPHQAAQTIPLNPSKNTKNLNNQQLPNNFNISPSGNQMPYYPIYGSFYKPETNYPNQEQNPNSISDSSSSNKKINPQITTNSEFGGLPIPVFNNFNNGNKINPNSNPVYTGNVLPETNTNGNTLKLPNSNLYGENLESNPNLGNSEPTVTVTATFPPFPGYTVQTTEEDFNLPAESLNSIKKSEDQATEYMLDKIDVRIKSDAENTKFPANSSKIEEDDSEHTFEAIETKKSFTNNTENYFRPSVTYTRKEENENVNEIEEDESPQKPLQIEVDAENFNYQEPEKVKPTKVKRKPYVKVKQTPPNGQTIRLRNGATQLDGYLEMKGANSKWGLVCDDISGWTLEEATIACRELGFIRGAELFWQGYPIKSESENIDVAVFSLNCTGSEEFMSECQIKQKSDSQCNVGKKAVGLRCFDNLASHCQPGEILYNHYCYKLHGKENPDDPGIKTEDASNQCKKFGGKLVDITTQYENDFISEWLIKKHPEVTSVVTGGIGISVLGRPMWLWEGTNDPMVFERWWSGWSGDQKIPKGSINGPLCIVLKKTFACEESDGEKVKGNEEDSCSADYFFWDVENCNDLQTSVFICKRPMDDIGCVIGTGEGYVGTANTTASGQPCLPWDHPKVVEGLSRRVSVQERSARLVGHNYCRNLGNPDRHPWCFIEGKGNSEYCAIPQCWDSVSGYHRSYNGIYSSCDENHFECKPGECIKKKWICDGQKDCSNNKDEELCTFFLQEFKKTQNKRMKGNGREKWNNMNENMCAKQCLISKNFKCKSFSYSKDNRFCHLSDTNAVLSGQLINASNWTYYEVIVESFDCTIENGFFGCQNGKCINISNVCDEKKNCEDGSDEKDCGKLGYQIRLAGSKDRHKGRVEVRILGKWGVICDDKFDLRDANVVCRELGFNYGAAEVLQHSQFPVENPLFLIDDLECFGNETSIKECSFPGWGKHNCGTEETVGVVCKIPGVECPSGEWQCKKSKECISISYLCDDISDCNDKSDEDKNLCNAPTQIRLTGGPNVSSGRLEITHFGIWGTVCDDDFNEEAANVVCKILGYYGPSIVKKNAFFGAGKGPIWLDEVHCSGNETHIEECAYPQWGKNNCKHDEDVGIICSQEIQQKSSKIKPIASSSSDDDSVGREEKLRQILVSECSGKLKPRKTFPHYKYERVVGGIDTAREAVPWQASIRVKSGTKKSVHWCGAIILSPYHILTAGHCLRDYNKAAYFVRIGDYDTEVLDLYEQEFGIDHLYIHPNFSKQINLNNDIGLIKIKGEIRFSEQVKPACMAPSLELYNPGTNCTVSGWGSVSAQSAGFARTLRRAFIPILEPTTCRAPFVYGNSLSEGMFCAGHLDGGVDSCQGDSGGPLICQYQDREYLFGITSWGHGCGRANKPGVYTNVAFYMNWIQEKIRLSIK